MDTLYRLLNKETYTRDDLVALLSLEDEKDIEALFARSYQVKKQYVGTKVYFRGIIELSNICEKNCYYCGIRKDNTSVSRYKLSQEEILDEAKWCYDAHYGSLVIQSGELCGAPYTEFIETIVRSIKKLTDGRLGITLSLGEQTEETYRRWYNAGAHRYLLRIETSNRELYKTLHPSDHGFDARRACIETLKKIGYYAGTGVMIGLPGQTMEHLADDILFFKQCDVDMIGMGPFIPHHETPLAHSIENFDAVKDKQLLLALKMIAVTRIFLKDVNIASTTALQALEETGRERGLLAGANIIMPNVTDTKYRRGYQLYDNKPCLDENTSMCAACLESRISAIGEMIGYDEWGDSPHYKNKRKAVLAAEES